MNEFVETATKRYMEMGRLPKKYALQAAMALEEEPGKSGADAADEDMSYWTNETIDQG